MAVSGFCLPSRYISLKHLSNPEQLILCALESLKKPPKKYLNNFDTCFKVKVFVVADFVVCCVRYTRTKIVYYALYLLSFWFSITWSCWTYAWFFIQSCIRFLISLGLKWFNFRWTQLRINHQRGLKCMWVRRGSPALHDCQLTSKVIILHIFQWSWFGLLFGFQFMCTCKSILSILSPKSEFHWCLIFFEPRDFEKKCSMNNVLGDSVGCLFWAKILWELAQGDFHIRMGIILGAVLVRSLVFSTQVPWCPGNGSGASSRSWIQKKFI